MLRKTQILTEFKNSGAANLLWNEIWLKFQQSRKKTYFSSECLRATIETTFIKHKDEKKVTLKTKNGFLQQEASKEQILNKTTKWRKKSHAHRKNTQKHRRENKSLLPNKLNFKGHFRIRRIRSLVESTARSECLRYLIVESYALQRNSLRRNRQKSGIDCNATAFVSGLRCTLFKTAVPRNPPQKFKITTFGTVMLYSIYMALLLCCRHWVV